jgi:hypothetical protein
MTSWSFSPWRWEQDFSHCLDVWLPYPPELSRTFAVAFEKSRSVCFVKVPIKILLVHVGLVDESASIKRSVQQQNGKQAARLVRDAFETGPHRSYLCFVEPICFECSNFSPGLSKVGFCLVSSISVREILGNYQNAEAYRDFHPEWREQPSSPKAFHEVRQDQHDLDERDPPIPKNFAGVLPEQLEFFVHCSRRRTKSIDHSQ